MTILELRTLTGLSQSKFAAYLEIPVANISHWEQGFRQPPEYVNKLIERILLKEGMIDCAENK
jgi:DNA-binding transcriptional regulator YiaG